MRGPGGEVKVSNCPLAAVITILGLERDERDDRDFRVWVLAFRVRV